MSLSKDKTKDNQAQGSPLPPPRTRHNPFNRVSQTVNSEYHAPHHFRSHSIRSAPGGRIDRSNSSEIFKSKITFRELHTSYGRTILADFNAWKHNKRIEAEKQQQPLITF